MVGQAKNVKDENYTGYRWVILILFSLINFFVSFCQFQPSFFAQDIMSSFGIGTVEFATITSAPMVAGFIIALIGGSFADRFGIRKIMIVGLIISSIGGLGRYFCQDYASLFVVTTLLGVSATFVMANTTKLCIQWFRPSELGIAIGIGMCTGSAGIAAAQGLTGIMFSDFRSAFLVGGIILIVLTIAWIVISRDKPGSVKGKSEGPSMLQGIKLIARNAHIWVAGIAAFFYTGFNITTGSFLITGLIENWAVDAVMAGIVSSLFTIGATVGSIVAPPIVQRIRSARVVSTFIPLFAAILVYVGWSIDIIAARCIIFPIAGLFFGATLPLIMLYPSVLPGVTEENTGVAGGMITMLMMLGAFVVPSFIITPIAGDNYALLIILDCIVCALMAISFALLPSLYNEKSKK